MVKCFPEGFSVFGTVSLSTQSLSSIGEAIHEIGKEQVELHHHCVDGKDHGPTTGTCRGEKEVYRHQTERTQEDVAVHVEEPSHRLADECSFHHQMAAQTTIIVYQQP